MGKRPVRKQNINRHALLQELRREQQKKQPPKSYIQTVWPDETDDEHKERCYEILTNAIGTGISQNTRDLTNFYNFFKNAGVSSAQLASILEKHQAKLLLHSKTLMQFHVREDKWRVELLADGKCILWHNDYTKTYDGERVMKDTFHKHRILGDNIAVRALETLVGYKCNMH